MTQSAADYIADVQALLVTARESIEAQWLAVEHLAKETLGPLERHQEQIADPNLAVGLDATADLLRQTRETARERTAQALQALRCIDDSLEAGDVWQCDACGAWWSGKTRNCPRCLGDDGNDDSNADARTPPTAAPEPKAHLDRGELSDLLAQVNDAREALESFVVNTERRVPGGDFYGESLAEILMALYCVRVELESKRKELESEATNG